MTGHRKIKRRAVRLSVALAALLGGWLTMVVGLQRWMVFPRFVTQPDPAAGARVEGLVRWTRDIGDGQVEAWLLPGDGVSADNPGPAVIHAHGNAELIDYWPDTFAAYRRMGISVLMPEYRGYGRSAGSPSQKDITDDFVYFYDKLAERPDVDAERIVFHGRSIGGGVVCALAAERRPAAMILSSTFTSITAMARRYLVPSFLVLDPFDNEKVLAELDVPVLLVHGSSDQMVPISHSRKLQKAARRCRLITYEADHNDCPPDWEVFWRDVRGFFQEQGILAPN